VAEGKASGDVEGKYSVGGLVGRNWEEGRVVKGKSTSGDVEGEENVGGLIPLDPYQSRTAKNKGLRGFEGGSQKGFPGGKTS